MPTALISDDGRWWWDGTHWRSRVVEGELDVLWFMTTPDWLSRILLTGLIGLIPIVGTINLYGWTLTATEMIQRRWRELPPAGFQYLERGGPPFVVDLVYGLSVILVIGLVSASALVIGLADRARIALAIALGLLAVALFVGWWLFRLYLLAALLLGPDRLGIAPLLNPRRLWMIARANHDVSLRVAVTYFLATLPFAAASLLVGVFIPFGGIAISVATPAIFAVIVPTLARVQVGAGALTADGR